MALFVEEKIVVHVSGIIGRVLTQEVENCSSIVGPMNEVNDCDLARIGQWGP